MHVVVVGAGLSGLSAAAQLVRHGARVTLLEASSRIGGRVRSEEIAPGVVAELGAQWVSRHHRRVIALARAAGAQIARSTYQDALLHEPPGPRLLPRLDALRLLAGLRAGMKGSDASNDCVSLAGWLRDRAWSHEGAAWLEKRLSSDLCVDVAGVSVLEVQRQIEAVGGMRALGRAEEFVIEGGASRLVEHLERAAGGAIAFEQPVARIAQQADSITLSGGGQEISGDYVILAIPPPLLNDIEFTPALPDERREALARFVPGRVVKTVALYATPWWRGSRRGGRQLDTPDFSGIVDGGLTGPRAALLVGLSTAARADAAGRIDPEARGGRLTSIVGAALGQSPQGPLTVRSVDWSTERHCAGGYAARRGLGGWVNSTNLFDPFGRIHFAGTEAATEWRSYMEGALAAGETAAASVLAGAGSASRV